MSNPEVRRESAHGAFRLPHVGSAPTVVLSIVSSLLTLFIVAFGAWASIAMRLFPSHISPWDWWGMMGGAILILLAGLLFSMYLLLPKQASNDCEHPVAGTLVCRVPDQCVAIIRLGHSAPPFPAWPNCHRARRFRAARRGCSAGSPRRPSAACR